jgi:hypothetical protein
MFTPTHLDELAVLIRQRSAKVLGHLPRNETFNFCRRGLDRADHADAGDVVRFPWEERRKLTRWSDVSTALPKSGIVESPSSAARRWTNVTPILPISGTSASMPSRETTCSR